MTFKELKLKTKEEQKYLAQQIRLGKPLRKPRIYDQASGDEIDAYHDLNWNRDYYRHTHIAYCQFFNNTPYALIEQPKDENKPSSHEIKRITQEWEAELDEALRDCA